MSARTGAATAGRAMLGACVLACATSAAHAAAPTLVTVATLNNPDMVELKKLSSNFEKSNPDIKLRWVILEENVLRQRATTDISTNSGQFDLMAIGTYEAPLWGKRGWLAPMTDLPADYDLADVVKTARDGLSYNGQLYALPFYVESSMTFYRKDLFAAKGLTMPDQPTYDQIKTFADRLTDRAAGVYGICLRGKAGWGENMAYVTTLANTFGGRWFDEHWKAQIDTPEWQRAITLYADLLRRDGPPGASSNGFNENLTLMSSGKCAMWIDATVAAGMLYNKTQSQVADKIGFAAAPVAVTPKGSHWLWSWALAIPKTSKSQAAAKKFATWATSKQYIELVAQDEGWASVPPGTRASTYARPEYKQAAPFGDFVLKAIESASPTDATLKKVPYQGVQ
ncbi:MAG: ABC transporter substrate-binding protein, partial [Janthinobacterium lividum]